MASKCREVEEGPFKREVNENVKCLDNTIVSFGGAENGGWYTSQIKMYLSCHLEVLGRNIFEPAYAIKKTRRTPVRERAEVRVKTEGGVANDMVPTWKPVSPN